MDVPPQSSSSSPSSHSETPLHFSAHAICEPKLQVNRPGGQDEPGSIAIMYSWQVMFALYCAASLAHPVTTEIITVQATIVLVLLFLFDKNLKISE